MGMLLFVAVVWALASFAMAVVVGRGIARGQAVVPVTARVATRQPAPIARRTVG